MRRLTAWIGGALGGITAYRFFRDRQAAPVAADAEAPPEPDDRAEELRARLAEARAAEPLIAEPPPAEAAVEEAPEPEREPEPESPEERRRRVHEEGRAAVDDMKSE
jgi:hypothetical protein